MQVLVLAWQPPFQPLKVEPVAGVAVSVTVAPRCIMARQVGEQLMPAGLLVMLPEPEPVRMTASSTGGGGGLKRAVTV